MIELAEPLWLVLLPLFALAFRAHGQTEINYSSFTMLPPDVFSKLMDWLLKLTLLVALLAIVIGLSKPYLPAKIIEKIGQGAQMLILVDSSGSMDRPFLGESDKVSRAAVWGTYTSKGQIARQMLSDYAAARREDMFAFFVFSANPIAVLPLTDKQAIVQAAISAGTIERGLASTNLGGGLMQSLEFFKDKPYSGSRIVMLVSDGAARLTPEMEDHIAYLLKKYRVTLYWIYLRDQHSPGLHTEMGAERAKTIAPEQIVHRFFQNAGVPYRAFPAEDPAALQKAIAEVDKLQKLPIKYQDIKPKKQLAHYFFSLAAVMLGILFVAKLFEIQRWR